MASLVVIAICLINLGRLGQPLELKSGAYEDLVIGVADSVPVGECETVLANVESTLALASQHLFSALDGRAFLRSATVILPASWPDSCAPRSVNSGTGDFTDVTILPNDLTRGAIWTQQSAGCGQPGDQIYLAYETLLKRDDILPRLFIKQFAMYRYGVFDEQGYENDPIYPTCYYDDENKRNRVTGCSDLPIKDNGICSPGEKNYNKTRLVDEKARSSLMFAAEVPSVSMFCDEGTHDQYAPTKHNLICSRRSTFDIISNHPDFSVNAISSNHYTNEITNTTPRVTYRKQNTTRYILVIENTKDMQVRESWNHLRNAIRKWVLFDLPQNSEVGVILAENNGAKKLVNILSLKKNTNPGDITSNLPYNTGDSGQPACLHCALKDAITMLVDYSKYRNGARNVIVLIAPGMNMNTQLENLTKEARKSKIRIATINYPDIVRSQPLDLLATQTDGVAYTVMEQKLNVEMSMLSTYFRLTNVLYNVIERFYSGNPSELSMEIHRRKLTDDGRTSITGSFVLDENMGEPARFMLYTHNTEQPLIRGLSLISPSHQEYTVRSENMVIAKILSLRVNISEPGTWTYTIERDAGNPQPHYVQVMATPRSRTVPVVRTKFWVRTNQPGGPLILLAEVKQGNWPVLGARVLVTFTRSEVNGSVAYSDSLELLDTGSGDPDITKGDGIYSRYFSAAAGGPGTYTFDATVTDNGNTAYTWQTNINAPDEKPCCEKPCCGSMIPKYSVQPLSPFQRYLPPITIVFTTEDMVRASQVVVGRIGDLKVQIKPDDMKALLTWTSPDLGGTRAARYQIKYSTILNDIVDNYEVLAKVWEHDAPHVLSIGTETTFTLDMTKAKYLLDKPLYFAIRAYPQMYSDSLASPLSNWVRVLVPSPPPPPTVPPTFIPNDHTAWPNQVNSVGVDSVGQVNKPGNFGIEVVLPIVIGVIILAIILSLYCYFCVIKRRNRSNHKKSHSTGLQTDKLSSAVTIVPSSPLHSSQNSQQGYVNHSDLPDHHTIGVPINSFAFEDEPKKRYSLVHQQEQQLIEELKQQQMQNQQRELNTPNNTYTGLSVISSNSLQRNGHTLSPYNSWSASQLLHEHERRHSPLDNMIPEDQLLAQHQAELDHMSLNGQNVDHISMGGHQIPDHYGQTHAPPVPPLPVYNSNGYPVNYNIYGVHQPQQIVATQQNHPIYQTMQRNESLAPYNSNSLQGSLNSVNSGEKKRRNVTMV